MAVVRLLADPRSAPGGEWYDAVAGWEARRIRKVARRARLAGAEGLITTEKDAVRLREKTLPGLPVWVLTVRMVLSSGQAAWVEALRQIAAPARG